MSDTFSNGNPAEAYQAFMVPTMFLPWSRELLNRVSPGDGERVLDIACGTGVVARGAVERVGPQGPQGVDSSDGMLKVARTIPVPNGVRIDWKKARAEELPFGDATFDVVLCQQGLQFFVDRQAGIREMRRVLKPGGRVGISVWLGPEHQSVKGALLKALVQRFGPGAMVPYSFGDKDAVQTLMVDAGFHDIVIGVVRREMSAPSVEEFIAMTVLGASAAVPALAKASRQEREEAISSIRAAIAADIDAARVGEGLEYPMKSHIITARA